MEERARRRQMLLSEGLWKEGPSSQSSPSHRSPSRMAWMASSVDRSASVSSIRRAKVLPCLRAKSQLQSAVRAPPMFR